MGICPTDQSWPNYEVWRHSPQVYPHIWYQLQIQGITKTTLTFDNLLEGLMELPEGCFTYSCGFLQRKDRLKSAEGVDAPGPQTHGQSLGGCRAGIFSVSLPRELAYIGLPESIGDNTPKCWVREAHSSSMRRADVGVSSHGHDWLTDWSLTWLNAVPSLRPQPVSCNPRSAFSSQGWSCLCGQPPLLSLMTWITSESWGQ